MMVYKKRTRQYSMRMLLMMIAYMLFMIMAQNIHSQTYKEISLIRLSPLQITGKLMVITEFAEEGITARSINLFIYRNIKDFKQVLRRDWNTLVPMLLTLSAVLFTVSCLAKPVCRRTNVLALCMGGHAPPRASF